MSSLTNAACATPTPLLSAYCASSVSKHLSQIVPPLLLSLWQQVVIPKTLYACVRFRLLAVTRARAYVSCARGVPCMPCLYVCVRVCAVLACV